jgi:hypothetical protein
MTEMTAALPNELALVAQANVDAAAFAALYDHYFSRIYNYILLSQEGAGLGPALFIVVNGCHPGSAMLYSSLTFRTSIRILIHHCHYFYLI